MKTSAIEMHDMLSVLSVEELERWISEVRGVERHSQSRCGKRNRALQRNATRDRRYQVGRAPTRV